MDILACILIGLVNGTCGVAYKIGKAGKVDPLQCTASVSLAGVLFFGILGGSSQWQALSVWQVMLGALLGISQYLMILLLRKALATGPLSPAWCAQSLNFVLVILYSTCFLGESLSLWQLGSLLAAIGAILAASLEREGGAERTSKCQVVLYGLLLVGILAATSVMSIGMKFAAVTCEPGQNVPMMNRSGFVLMAFVNLFSLICSAMELTWKRQWVFSRCAVISGTLISVCGVSGTWLTVVLVSIVPAAILFVIANSASILVASLISVFCFHEKRSTAWRFTIGLSLLAILLNRG